MREDVRYGKNDPRKCNPEMDHPTERLNIGDIVQHFKREVYTGNDPNYYLYKILAFANHTETGELLVVYESLYSSEDGCIVIGNVVCRPYEMFMSKVDKDKYPTIRQTYRFERFKV